jgi:hypothetical protein
MPPKSAAAKKQALHYPSDHIQFVQDLISAGAVLNEKAAKEAWQTISPQARLFESEGKLLVDFLQVAPINLDGTYFARYILTYLAKEGTFPDSIWQYVSEAALALRVDLKLPVDKVRPLLLGLEDSKFVRALIGDPELYGPELEASCLRCLTQKTDFYGINTKQKLFALLPESFRTAHWTEILPSVVNLDSQETLGYFFELAGPILKDSEKEKVILDLIQGMVPRDDGYDPNRLKWLYSAIKKNLPAFLQGPVLGELKTKTEKLLTAENTEDPIEAYLVGKISWEEAQFAKANPEEYKKAKAASWQREGNQDWAVRFGPPPWLMYRGGGRW